MVERNELITACRQVGGMMEAGVDILRITRVLRQQTDNPRLLQLYDALDHDMTMGHGLADAMSHAPDVFSPFMVLMVQQGEARNDLAGSFFKIADYIQKDGELAQESASRETSETDGANHDSAHDSSLQMPISAAVAASATGDALANRVLDLRSNAPTAPLTVIALDGLIDRLQTFALRALTVISGLLLSLAGVWWSVEMGWLERRWSYPTAFSVAAIFMGASGIVIQRRIQSQRRREARCSFCGRPGTDGDELQRAPRFAGAAICSRCAGIVAGQPDAHDQSERNEVSRKTTMPDAARLDEARQSTSQRRADKNATRVSQAEAGTDFESVEASDSRLEDSSESARRESARRESAEPDEKTFPEASQASPAEKVLESERDSSTRNQTARDFSSNASNAKTPIADAVSLDEEEFE